MPYLDAALAFALTMLAVATLVTQLVRFGQFLTKTRAKVMKEMLEEYFKKEQKPVVDRELSRLKRDINNQIAAEVRTHADKLQAEMPFTEDELKNLVDVSTEEITELLKRSEMGKKLLEELGDKANTFFDELANHYELVGRKFTKSFRENARWWATGVALALAFFLNIDSIFIANTYITNGDMRQAVIAQKDALEEGYNTLVGKFEQEQDKIEITKEEFEQVFADTQEQLDIFTSIGFPIGWSFFPHSALRQQYLQSMQSKNVDLSRDYEDRANPLGWLSWIVGCVLTGLLAGLGGPFWYDVVAGISSAIKNLRNQKA